MSFIIFLILGFLICIHPVHANYDPLSVPNNKYGIHIVDTNDMSDVGSLVNSNGGDWGYVTIVLSDSDRDHDRWQTIFNNMRRLHLIPIIRLATHADGPIWVKPSKDRFYEIIHLLNGLNWPTANRYVILYNEPNHANEWGGDLNPEEYADYLVTFTRELKRASPDYFVLPAGLDASAISDGDAMDEAEYLRRMVTANPEVLILIDGWTSHSYPNPGFSGSPYAAGRGTLWTFDWELSYLTQLGLMKQMPVFITETGWQHSEGKTYIPGLLSSDQVGQNLRTAAQNIWNDPRIAAVTPFLLNYQDIPFDHFSWREIGSRSYYSQYYAYREISKPHGTPLQHESYSLKNNFVPESLVSGSIYTLTATIQNKGQGIIDAQDGYALTFTDNGSDIYVSFDVLPTIEPNASGTITALVKTPDKTGSYHIAVDLLHHDFHMVLQESDITLIPPPTVEVHANLGWRKTSNASDVTLLLYDKHALLQKFTGLTMKNGVVKSGGLVNIIPGNPYRVVVLVHGYLPRQTITALGGTVTTVYPNRFLPLDFNNDGTFTFADLRTLVRYPPWTAVLRFFGP